MKHGRQGADAGRWECGAVPISSKMNALGGAVLGFGATNTSKSSPVGRLPGTGNPHVVNLVETWTKFAISAWVDF